MTPTEQKILEEIDKLEDEMLQSIQEIVQIKSVVQDEEANDQAPYGPGPKKALDKALQISKDLGFETVNLENRIGYAQYGQSEEYIASVGHLDVVPEGDGWKFPPYSGQIAEGKMYGRGVLDNKGPLLTTLFALKAIKNSGVEIDQSIRIIFGCDEETGRFSDIDYYLKQEKPPKYGFTPDCKYSVVYSERGRAALELRVTKDKIENLFSFINHYFIGANNTGDRLGIDYYNEEYGTMEMRGYKLKEVEDEVLFEFVLSYPAGITIEEIIIQIEKHTNDAKIALELLKNYDPVLFDKNSKMIQLFGQTYEEVTGLDGTPVTTTGGTYAKRMPNIVPFGPSFPGQKGIGHQPNEWMKIEDLITNAKIYTLALYRLSHLEE